MIRAYLEARWRGAPGLDVDDAVQDVFMDCLRDDGALGRVDSQAPGGFRAFLYGVTRNVARRTEARRRADQALRNGALTDLDDLEGREPTPSEHFERAWAESLMDQAASLQAQRAKAGGPETVRRVELLRLRFEAGLPIRDIAARWGLPAPLLHREYASAREEFRRALADVVREHQGGTDASVGAECARLLDHLD